VRRERRDCLHTQPELGEDKMSELTEHGVEPCARGLSASSAAECHGYAGFLLDALSSHPLSLVGGVDWSADVLTSPDTFAAVAHARCT
jgi:hypothetical protein